MEGGFYGIAISIPNNQAAYGTSTNYASTQRTIDRIDEYCRRELISLLFFVCSFAPSVCKYIYINIYYLFYLYYLFSLFILGQLDSY